MSLPDLPKLRFYDGEYCNTVETLLAEGRQEEAKILLEGQIGEKLAYVFRRKDGRLCYEIQAEFEEYKRLMLEARVEHLESLLLDFEELQEVLLDDNDFERAAGVKSLRDKVVDEIDSLKNGSLDF